MVAWRGVVAGKQPSIWMVLAIGLIAIEASKAQAIRSSYSLFNYYPYCKYNSNQGACHLSWASTVAQTVAFQICANSPKGEYVPLSPQSLVNCVYNKDKTGYCSTFTSINDVSAALKRVKEKGLFRLSEERYSSGNDGFKLLCTDYHGSVSISGYDQLFDATFKDIAQVLMGGRPVIATLLLTPGTYFPKPAADNIMRLDGNVSNYGYYSVMIYGWIKDSTTGVYSYLYDSPFGKAWRDNGSSTIEVDSFNILNFYTVTL